MSDKTFTTSDIFFDIIAAVNTLAHGELKGHVSIDATNIGSCSSSTSGDLDQKLWTVVTFSNVNRRQMLNIASVYDWLCNETYGVEFNTASDKNFVRWYLDDSFKYKKEMNPVQNPPKAKIRISEIFGPTIQGEGCLVGTPTIFVRAAGCDYRCKWCDTRYAVDCEQDLWKEMTCEEIFAVIKELSPEPILVTLSGGNPALFDFTELINMGHDEGYTFAIETQGSVYKDWFELLDYMTVSPKPPSSGMETNYEKLTKCIETPMNTKIILKIVVGSDGDYDYAKKIFAMYPQVEHYITPCNANPGNPNLEQIYKQTRYIADKMIQDKLYNVAIVPQLHVLLWQNQRGV